LKVGDVKIIHAARQIPVDQAEYEIEMIKTGLKLFAEKDSRDFKDFLNENDDACTSDNFLQLCLFGELVFG